MIVMKFGGTSVGDAERIRNAAGLVRDRRDLRPLVVVSALAGVTNRLLHAAEAAEAGRGDEAREALDWIRRRHDEVLDGLRLEEGARRLVREDAVPVLSRLAVMLEGVEALGECTGRTRDAIAATGELLSLRLFAAALGERGVDAVPLDPREVMRTDDSYGRAEPDPAAIAALSRERLAPILGRGEVPVTGGFVGADVRGITTTLGRGGSDLSATLFGVALGAEEVQIWTDVDGMMTADPRVVPAARSLPEVSFQEASELAWFGAKVLHPATIRPAVERRIPVRVLNALNPSHPGTLIRDLPAAESGPGKVRAVAWKKGISVVSVSSPRMLGAHGFLARVFDVFDRHGTPVDVVTTSEVSVSMTVDRPGALEAIARDLGDLCQVRLEGEMALVCLVGRRLLEHPPLVGEVLRTLEGIPLRMFCLGSSDINLTFVLEEARAEEAVRRLHARFLEERS